MAIQALTGKDTIVINGKVLGDFGDGDIVSISYPNDLVEMKIGKNGNTIYALNQSGMAIDVELRIIAASSDDKFLNSLMTGMLSDFPSFTPLTGSFAKKVGSTSIVYTLSGGIFAHKIDAKENIEGNTDQAIAVYKLKFSNATRSI